MNEEEVAEIVAWNFGLNERCDELDRAGVNLWRAGLNRHAVYEVLAWHDIDADVLDGPFLVVGGEVVEVGADISDASLLGIA